MSLEQTQRTIDHYFDVMSRGGDFAEYYTADVTWTTTDTGDEVRGPSSVRDYIVALHNNMFDSQTRRIVVSDGHAYLEGDCVDAPTETSSRIFTASRTTSSMTKSQPCAATVPLLTWLANSLRSHPRPAE
jgi:hypothetical protein